MRRISARQPQELAASIVLTGYYARFARGFCGKRVLRVKDVRDSNGSWVALDKEHLKEMRARLIIECCYAKVGSGSKKEWRGIRAGLRYIARANTGGKDANS